MQQCKNIGCRQEVNPLYNPDYCVECCPSNDILPLADSHKHSRDFCQHTSPQLLEGLQSSGGDNDYWVAEIRNPKRLDPYKAECEDLIEHFQMSFQEGEAFKALWRNGMLRLGMGKPGDSHLRNAEKVQHFGNRMVAMETQALELAS